MRRASYSQTEIASGYLFLFFVIALDHQNAIIGYFMLYRTMMRNIVLVGAGGTGMSGLAMMLYDLGYHNIVCINNIKTALTDRLERHGLQVVIGHGNYEVQIDDVVIYSDIQAIIDGPEISKSREYQQMPTPKHFHICLTYNQFLAEISKRFTTIGVSGSNGKTSTTALLIYALSQISGEQFVSQKFGL